MLCAYLSDLLGWQPMLLHAVMQRCLAWLEQHAAKTGLGEYSLGEPDWYVNVHTYQTLPEPDCVWESHTQTADVQYMITGAEGIRWLPASELTGPLRTFTGRDRLEWAPPGQTTSLLTLRAGMCVIFLPGEAHCPMIALDTPMPIRKAVVKIPARLLDC